MVEVCSVKLLESLLQQIQIFAWVYVFPWIMKLVILLEPNDIIIIYTLNNY